MRTGSKKMGRVRVAGRGAACRASPRCRVTSKSLLSTRCSSSENTPLLLSRVFLIFQTWAPLNLSVRFTSPFFVFRLYTLDTLPEFTELPPPPHEPIVSRNDELDILQLMIECPTLSKAQE